jgi:hypothetical protein
MTTLANRPNTALLVIRRAGPCARQACVEIRNAVERDDFDDRGSGGPPA